MLFRLIENKGLCKKKIDLMHVEKHLNTLALEEANTTSNYDCKSIL